MYCTSWNAPVPVASKFAVDGNSAKSPFWSVMGAALAVLLMVILSHFLATAHFETAPDTNRQPQQKAPADPE